MYGTRTNNDAAEWENMSLEFTVGSGWTDADR